MPEDGKCDAYWASYLDWPLPYSRMNTARAATSITINDVSDDYTIPFSYSTSGNHYDEVAFNVSGGNFYVQLTLVPVSGDFRRLSIALAGYVAPESACLMAIRSKAPSMTMSGPMSSSSTASATA